MDSREALTVTTFPGVSSVCIHIVLLQSRLLTVLLTESFSYGSIARLLPTVKFQQTHLELYGKLSTPMHGR